MNKIWFDTEFIENGSTIELLSIGLVREDGQSYYAEPKEMDTNHDHAHPWVKENVIPLLWKNPKQILPRNTIAKDIFDFVGDSPEFWAYYSAYDWVALCQLYGTMMELPPNFPMFCRDVKQLAMDKGNPQLPKQTSIKHHALNDAIWTYDAYMTLIARKNRGNESVITCSRSP